MSCLCHLSGVCATLVEFCAEHGCIVFAVHLGGVAEVPWVAGTFHGRCGLLAQMLLRTTTGQSGALRAIVLAGLACCCIVELIISHRRIPEPTRFSNPTSLGSHLAHLACGVFSMPSMTRTAAREGNWSKTVSIEEELGDEAKSCTECVLDTFVGDDPLLQSLRYVEQALLRGDWRVTSEIQWLRLGVAG